MRRIVIVGGGLAGLGLGLALRRAKVPVTLHEAGCYPRHRVCGEFITSLDEETSKTLGLSTHLRPAIRASGVSWCEDGAADIEHRLPQPALCLSRLHLDQSMAEEYLALGGELRTNSRVAPSDAPGWINATGRRPDSASSWVGIKQHFRGLALRNDLEVHLGRGGYVGLTQVEDGRVNVCGLLDKSKASVAQDLAQTLERGGFGLLAERLRGAEPVADSFCAVAGLNYRTRAGASEDTLRIGDGQSLVPPFTGHGMTMALQSAAAVLPHMLEWARGRTEWAETKGAAQRTLHRRFGSRLRFARAAHPLLLDARVRRCARGLNSLGVLPVALLYRMMH